MASTENFRNLDLEIKQIDVKMLRPHNQNNFYYV